MTRVDAIPVHRHRLGLGLAAIGWYLPFAGSATVLLPARIAELDPVGKTAALGLTTGAGAVVALVANLGFGILSDRTTSRFGRRRPWILAGALGGALALALCSVVPTTGWLAVSWCGYSFALNAFLAALLATVADTVPPARRGAVSAGYGAGLLLGQVLGVVAGSVFLSEPAVGLGVLAPVFLAAGVVVVLLVPDPPLRTGISTPLGSGVRRLCTAFGSTDFRWVFVGRLLFYAVVSLVLGFQLYVLTDYIGLAPDRAGTVLVQAGLLIGAAALVSTLVAGTVSDRLGRRRLPIVVAASLLAVAALLPPAVPTTAAFLVFVGVAAAGYGAFQSVDTALMTEVLPGAADNARDLGVLNVATAGGQASGPLAVPVLIGTVGYTGVFVTMTVVAALSALTVLGVRTVR